MRSFVCNDCSKPEPDSWNQYTVRIEIRSVDGKRRATVVTQAHICCDCIPARIEQLRREEANNQEAFAI